MLARRRWIIAAVRGVVGCYLILQFFLFNNKVLANDNASLPSQQSSSNDKGGGGDGGGCRLSEHRCLSSGKCLAQDKFCDGENDCEDKSDEPAYCTPCNRSLFGDVGRTYELQIRKPREEKLPFLCHLNFTAAGGELGDLVQLTFDTFTVGRFLSFTSDGCPDGYMTIGEENRPPTGGQWCGSAWGYTVYYSETRSINLTLYLSRLSGQGSDYNFDFKLSYKYLKRSEAHLRYGNNSLITYRGDLVNGTYCDRVFTRCDQRPCRIQSPNYPGVYPRNLTCYYRIEQKRSLPGYRSLLSINQRNGHKIHIKDQNNKYDTSQRSLRLWDQCMIVQDYLTIYDGGSTNDRILIRLCGGDSVPDIIASKDVMLLEFHTSPYDNPFHPIPLSFLPGFELEVQVIFVDEKSTASFVVKDREKCDFYINSYESQSGTLENPKHSLPPNTTCRYHFQGKHNEVVWLAFVKYYASTGETSNNLVTHQVDTAECNAKLSIWNGERRPPNRAQRNPAAGTAREARSEKTNATLMGEFCKDETPRLCDHSLLRNESRHTRPCSMSESYVSNGRFLTLEHVLKQGSALYPVSFVVRYEFVYEGSSCNRLFVPTTSSGNSPVSFVSSKSVFFYGRGGSENLTCIYRFEAGPDKRLELSILKASFGGKKCESKVNPLVNRLSCEVTGKRSDGIAQLTISEYPWQGVKLPRDCLCSSPTEKFLFQSLTSAVVELKFVVTRMNVTQDYHDFYFEGEYKFVPANGPSEALSGGWMGGHSCAAPGTFGNLNDSPRLSRMEDRRLRGTSGEISLRSPALPTAQASSSSQDHLNSLATVDESLSSGNLGLSLDATSKGSKNSKFLNSKISAVSAIASEVTRCVNEPWLIEPEDTRLHFLYLKIPGFRLHEDNVDECQTKNRIVVYSAVNPTDMTIVCPAESNGTIVYDGRFSSVVDLISGGWNESSQYYAQPLSAHQQHHARSFVVEFLQQEPGYYVVTWMAISKRIVSHAVAECPYRCPELEACISSALWCDGVRHCPSGFDELEENCSYRFGATLLYVAVATGALGIFLILLLATGCLKYCLYRRRRLERQKKLSQTNTSINSDSIDRKTNSKKVQVLNVKQLNTPNHTLPRNNGLDITAGINDAVQPRYANSTFTRIGRYDLQHRYYEQHYQQHSFNYDDNLQVDVVDDVEGQDCEDKFSKDSIC